MNSHVIDIDVAREHLLTFLPLQEGAYAICKTFRVWYAGVLQVSPLQEGAYAIGKTFEIGSPNFHCMTIVLQEGACIICKNTCNATYRRGRGDKHLCTVPTARLYKTIIY